MLKSFLDNAACEYEHSLLHEPERRGMLSAFSPTVDSSLAEADHTRRFGKRRIASLRR
jgi:hypothetical protein